MNYKITFMFFIYSLYLANSFGQQSAVSTGGEATGTNGKVSFSIGQVCFTPIQSSQGSVLQGIQQAYEIYILDLSDSKKPDFNILVYPNPTEHYLELITNQVSSQNLLWTLSDINGKTCQLGKIHGKSTSINMESFPPSSYILSIIENNKLQYSFKIIKK